MNSPHPLKPKRRLEWATRHQTAELSDEIDPCEISRLVLLLHQDVKGTFTPKLSNMHGVPKRKGEPGGPPFGGKLEI